MDEKYIGIYENIECEAVLTIVQRDNKLIAGGVCNVGLMEQYSMDIDADFSMDENLQAFFEDIEEQLRNERD